MKSKEWLDKNMVDWCKFNINRDKFIKETLTNYSNNTSMVSLIFVHIITLNNDGTFSDTTMHGTIEKIEDKYFIFQEDYTKIWYCFKYDDFDNHPWRSDTSGSGIRILLDKSHAKIK